jgi:hypothetical protein
MLQAGRSRIREPMRWMNFFFNLRNPSGRTRPWGLLSPYEYQKQKNLFWGVKCGRSLGLTTLAPSVSRLSPQHLTTLLAFTACYSDSLLRLRVASPRFTSLTGQLTATTGISNLRRTGKDLHFYRKIVYPWNLESFAADLTQSPILDKLVRGHTLVNQDGAH